MPRLTAETLVPGAPAYPSIMDNPPLNEGYNKYHEFSKGKSESAECGLFFTDEDQNSVLFLFVITLFSIITPSFTFLLISLLS